MSIFSKLRSTSRRFWQREDGTSTIEFVVIFPAFAMMMMGGYEIGYYTVSHTMMDRGLDLAMRDVRLGKLSPVTANTLKHSVCEYAKYVANCEAKLHIAMEPVDAVGFVAPPTAACLDKTTNAAPNTTFEDGDENELMLVRACINVEPIFPTTWIGGALQPSPTGDLVMSTTAAFVNEPNT
ncbi:TadE/TadG family type IV pilus assembly protein [Celeribacter marinus]|uniref:TadE/TadG family type IV pilus assembly protein n=1 Tax=Celeribacter marinus TaxID=1397108 RepID=UPI003F6B7D83